SYEKLYKGYGEQMLNPMPRFNKISDDIFEGASHLFIKPTRDAKVFTGKVFTEDEWIEFSQDLIKNPEHKWVDENTQIVSSESVDIIKEARFWIIEGKVISSSYYRFHGDLPFEDSVSEEALQYVRNITQQYQVGEAYVLDVALTWDGWRVVEANCINCAGFYNAEIGKIFEAIIAAFDF
ncbi:MAG: ATP-grasp domain-containing protein, partial [Flavobacteriales bacterium]|nr:ATP-grasp domain-containing protein [Flavobacteriales bacterium]